MKKYLFIGAGLQLAFVGSMAAFLIHVQSAKAVTETNISRTIELNRFRVSSTDVNTSPTSTDPDGSCSGLAKKVTVATIPAGGQVLSVVTKANTAFAGSGITQIGVRAVRAEQGGVQLSNGDIAMPATDLTDTSYIENRIPASGEYAFYDENASWNVVAYVCGQDGLGNPTSLSSLSAGSVDFYISMTK